MKILARSFVILLLAAFVALWSKNTQEHKVEALAAIAQGEYQIILVQYSEHKIDESLTLSNQEVSNILTSAACLSWSGNSVVVWNPDTYFVVLITDMFEGKPEISVEKGFISFEQQQYEEVVVRALFIQFAPEENLSCVIQR